MKEFFNSLDIPLKETSAIFRALFMAIALEFDTLLSYAQERLKDVFPQYAKNPALFGKERGVEKIQGETDASYALRVAKAYGFLNQSSTKKGIEDILRQFTQKSFILEELHNRNWILGAEYLGEDTHVGHSNAFSFVLNFTQPLTLAEKKYIEKLIATYKPAHTLCRVQAIIQDDWLLGIEGEVLGDATYL